jgi:hypothetical protein
MRQIKCPGIRSSSILPHIDQGTINPAILVAHQTPIRICAARRRLVRAAVQRGGIRGRYTPPRLRPDIVRHYHAVEGSGRMQVLGAEVNIEYRRRIIEHGVPFAGFEAELLLIDV